MIDTYVALQVSNTRWVRGLVALWALVKCGAGAQLVHTKPIRETNTYKFLSPILNLQVASYVCDVFVEPYIGQEHWASSWAAVLGDIQTPKPV